MKAIKAIKAFGNEDNLAKLLKLNKSTVFRWTYPVERGGTGGYVPSRQIPRILLLAKKYGVDIKDD